MYSTFANFLKVCTDVTIIEIEIVNLTDNWIESKS